MARSAESWDISVPLRKMLDEKKWSHKKLAAEAGIQRTDITRMVSKTNPLKAGRARAGRIADALGVTPFDLGLPPEEGDGEVMSALARLAKLEETLERVLQGMLDAGIAIPAAPAASRSAASVRPRKTA